MSKPEIAQPNIPLLLIEAFEALRTFRLIGEMDLSNSCWVGATLDPYATSPGDLTLDLGRLKFLDGAGRLVLDRLAGKLGEGDRLIVRNPSEAVARLLTSSRFQPVPKLVVDRGDWPEAGSAEAKALAQETGVTSHMWGVLALAQSLMPMADEVSLTVRNGGGLTTPVATGSDATACDAVQYQLNDGPCVRAAQQGSTEVFDVSGGEELLRPFLETARDRGISAVLSIPILREPSKPVGALNLYSRATGAFPAVEVPKAQVLAIRASRIFRSPGA